MSGTVEVPLRGRDGALRAVALIDAADADAVLAHRWYLDARGYVRRNVPIAGGQGQATVRLHRELMGLTRGDPRKVDHVNHDPLDNRRANLRVCSHAENLQNREGGYGRSRYRGVIWLKSAGKWQAQVNFGGKNHYLGRFTDELEAARAAAEFRAAHMPFSQEAAA